MNQLYYHAEKVDRLKSYHGIGDEADLPPIILPPNIVPVFPVFLIHLGILAHFGRCLEFDPLRFYSLDLEYFLLVFKLLF